MQQTFSFSHLLKTSNPSDIYVYPIIPGTDAWKSLKSHDQMLEVLQIPQATLSKMSTEGLVETVLNYPLFGDWRAYDSSQEGFEKIISRFNGLQELLIRSDAGKLLLAKYKIMDPLAVQKEWTNVVKGAYSFSFQNIELLLAQDKILTILSKEKRDCLLLQSMKKYKSKLKYNTKENLYSIASLEINVCLMGRVLQKENYAPFLQRMKTEIAIQDYLKTIFKPDVETAIQSMNEIVSLTQQYINNK